MTFTSNECVLIDFTNLDMSYDHEMSKNLVVHVANKEAFFCGIFSWKSSHQHYWYGQHLDKSLGNVAAVRLKFIQSTYKSSFPLITGCSF